MGGGGGGRGGSRIVNLGHRTLHLHRPASRQSLVHFRALAPGTHGVLDRGSPMVHVD